MWAITALFSAAQALNGARSGHNLGLFGCASGAELAQKLQHLRASFFNPFPFRRI
jgi:hypothetical protein